MYVILPYSYKKAKKINVVIKPSVRKNKKIDVYKNGKYIVSIGAVGYLDYPYYLKYFGKVIADEKRRLYKKRHQKDRIIKYSAGWYADQLLW